MNPMTKVRGLSFGSSGHRDHWLHDNSLGPDIPGRNMVCWASEPAGHTNETGLRDAVSLIHEAALGASPAGIPRVNEDYRDTRQSSLVLDKAAKLEERPVGLARPLTPTKPFPVLAYPLEVFQGDTPLGVFGVSHQPLADDVVRVALEALLSPRDTPELSSGRSSLLALEVAAAVLKLAPGVLNLLAREGFTIRIDCEIDDAEVNPQVVRDFSLRGFGGVNGHKEIEDAIPEHEVGLASAPVDTSRLILSQPDGDYLTPGKCQQAHRLHALPRHDALIILDGPIGPEVGLNAPVSLVGFHGLRDSADGQLRRETETGANVIVDQLLEGHLVGTPFSEGDPGDGIASGVEASHRLQQGAMLAGIGSELDRQRQFHGSMITQERSINKERAASSPCLKAGASAA